MVKNLPANAGDEGSVPESGRAPGEGNGNPLQYSCLESPLDRGAWWASVWGHQEWDMTEQLNNNEDTHLVIGILEPRRTGITCQTGGSLTPRLSLSSVSGVDLAQDVGRRDRAPQPFVLLNIYIYIFEV